MSDNRITKSTNHAGGILGGISDGSERTPSAAVIPETILLIKGIVCMTGAVVGGNITVIG